MHYSFARILGYVISFLLIAKWGLMNQYSIGGYYWYGNVAEVFGLMAFFVFDRIFLSIYVLVLCADVGLDITDLVQTLQYDCALKEWTPADCATAKQQATTVYGIIFGLQLTQMCLVLYLLISLVKTRGKYEGLS